MPKPVKTWRPSLMLAASVLALSLPSVAAVAQTAPVTPATSAPALTPPVVEAVPVPETTAEEVSEAEVPAPQTAADTDRNTDNVVVTAERLRGTVEGAPEPIQTLEAADIEATGATSIAELLATLAPVTTSGRGRGGGGQPVVLINGRRVSGFQELRTIPPEAIERVQVLPEETAVQFGFSADQRVLNFILKESFRARTVEVEAGTGVDWLGREVEGELGYTDISKTGRLNLTAEVADVEAITQADRGIVDENGADTRFRTLQNERQQIDLGANWNRALTKEAALTADVRYTNTETRGLQGIIGTRVLEQVSVIDTYRGALTADGYVGDWQWTTTGSYDRTDRATDSDLADGSVSRSTSLSETWELVGNTSGPIVEGPAGPIRGSLRLGVQDRSLESRTTRTTGVTSSDLGRTETLARANLNVPLTELDYGLGERIGQWNLSLNASYTEFSDFGGLSSVGGNLAWTPIEGLRFNVSADRSEAAPSIQQLGDAILITPNVSVFDFSRGETVQVTQTTGGNPGLNAEERTDWSLGVNWEVKAVEGLSLQATYAQNRSDDVISSFPVLTPALEAAFPGRFTRDAAGVLVAIDRRAVNFAERETEQLRWGFNYSRDIGQAPVRGGPGGPGGGFGGPPGAGAGPRGPGAGAPGAGPGGQRPEGARGPGAAAAGAAAQGGAPGAPGAGRQPGAGAGAGGPTVVIQGGPPGGGPPRGGPPGGGGFRGGGFAFGGGGPGGRPTGAPGRWNVSVFHTWKLKDTALLGAGTPELDLLDGDALSSGGGSPRHTVEVEGGAFYRGAGFRVSVNYEGDSRIDGTGTSSTLFFEETVTVGLRGFVNFNARPDWIEKAPWLSGARLVMRVDNLTDTFQRVRDGNGQTPSAFQRGFQQPRGRYVELALRKQF